MGDEPGYTATMLLATERPDLLPLLKLIFVEMGEDAFNEGLAELLRRGLIVAVPQ